MLVLVHVLVFGKNYVSSAEETSFSTDGKSMPQNKINVKENKQHVAGTARNLIRVYYLSLRFSISWSQHFPIVSFFQLH